MSRRIADLAGKPTPPIAHAALNALAPRLLDRIILTDWLTDVEYGLIYGSPDLRPLAVVSSDPFLLRLARHIVELVGMSTIRPTKGGAVYLPEDREGADQVWLLDWLDVMPEVKPIKTNSQDIDEIDPTKSEGWIVLSPHPILPRVRSELAGHLFDPAELDNELLHTLALTRQWRRELTRDTFRNTGDHEADARLAAV